MSIKADLVEFKMFTESFKAQVWSLTLSAVFGGSNTGVPLETGKIPLSPPQISDFFGRKSDHCTEGLLRECFGKNASAARAWA